MYPKEKACICVAVVLVSAAVSSFATKISASSRNFASSDFKVLANIDGYFEFNRSTFETDQDKLPLDLHAVSYKPFDHLDQLNLQMSDLDLLIDYYIDHDGYDNDFVYQIEVDFKRPINGQTNCFIYSTMMESSPDKHYSCQIEKSFDCSREEKAGPLLVGSLVLKSFEFEVNGDVDTIKRGEFSKPAYPCD